MKKEIKGIEPYNDLYYSYCLYNSLFSSIKYHSADILPIMINGVPEYFYNKDSGKFGVYYKKVENQNKIISQIGLKSIILDELTEFNEFIKQSIDNDGPVIINIDWFYMSNQKQTYNKTHRMHTILVVGYDEESKMYSIFDQKFVDTLSYSMCEVSFKSLKEAYDGYLELCKKKYSHGVFSILKNDNQKNDYYSISIIEKKYIENILNEVYWKRRICIINDYLNHIDELLEDSNYINAKFNSVLAGLNDIINHKNVEKFVYNSLFEGQIKNINVIEKTIEDWNIIRSILLKSSFVGVIREKDKLRIIELLNDIKELEERFRDKIPCY